MRFRERLRWAKQVTPLVLALTVLALTVSACSSTPTEPPANVLAIQDYIAVAELPEVRRFRSDTSSRIIGLDNLRYVLLDARRQTYLIEFDRDCRALYDNEQLTADVRADGDRLRAGLDTIRGCRINRAFELNEGQQQEIMSLGDAPTGG